MHSSHAAIQRANISLIDRRLRWPRGVPARARQPLRGTALPRASAWGVLLEVTIPNHDMLRTSDLPFQVLHDLGMR